MKLLTFGTATSVIAGKLWRREVLAFCDPLPGQQDAVFKVRVSDYPALLQDLAPYTWASIPCALTLNRFLTALSTHSSSIATTLEIFTSSITDMSPRQLCGSRFRHLGNEHALSVSRVALLD